MPSYVSKSIRNFFYSPDQTSILFSIHAYHMLPYSLLPFFSLLQTYRKLNLRFPILQGLSLFTTRLPINEHISILCISKNPDQAPISTGKPLIKRTLRTTHHQISNMSLMSLGSENQPEALKDHNQSSIQESLIINTQLILALLAIVYVNIYRQRERVGKIKELSNHKLHKY